MGCGSSTEAGSGAGGTSAMQTFELFSAKSLNCGSVKSQKGPMYSDGGDKLEDEFPRNGDTKEFALAWGVTASNPVIMRWTIGGESMQEMTKSLDGATIDVPDDKCFHVVLASFFPWAAPCALIKKMTFDDKYKGSLVILPKVTTVDIYVTVDGKPQEDGLMFKENASLTDPSIAQGVPAGAFCTLVSKQFSGRDEHGIHLPCVATSAETASLLNASSEYGGAFSVAFGAMLGRAGEGSHDYTLRVCPRGFVDDDENISGWGIMNAYPYTKFDVAAREFVETKLINTVFSSAPHPGLCASFKLTIGATLLAKSAAAVDKVAPEGITGCSAREELCGLASNFATGTPATKAGEALGSGIAGQPAHIILATSKDYGNDVGETTVRDKEKRVKRARTFVYVWALWLAPGAEDDDEAKGVMTRFLMEKATIEKFAKVAEPRWKLSRTYAAEIIRNKQIKAAVERDA